MGVAEGIAAAGLIVGALGTGYSIYSSEQAAKEAEEIADANARREAMEAEEMAQRAEKEAAREQSLSRARAEASGVGGLSQDLYLEDQRKTSQREISWIRKSGASRSDITRKTGYAQASAERNAGYAAGIQGLGNTVSGAADWYKTYHSE